MLKLTLVIMPNVLQGHLNPFTVSSCIICLPILPSTKLMGSYVKLASGGLPPLDQDLLWHSVMLGSVVRDLCVVEQ